MALTQKEKNAPRFAMFANGDVEGLARFFEPWLIKPDSPILHPTIHAILAERFFSISQLEYLRTHKPVITKYFPGVRPRLYEEYF